MGESTRTVFLVFLVVFIALVGGRFIQRRHRGVRPSLFRMTAAVYLALGLLLGGQGVGLLEGEMLGNLEPVLELALGWTGLLFGLQLGIRRLRRFPRGFLAATFFQSMVSMFLLAGVLYLGLGYFLPQKGREFWQVLIIMSLVGAVSSPAETALASASGGNLRPRLARLAHYVTSLDPLLPVLFFGVSAGFYHREAGGGIIPAVEWTVVSALLGLLLGLLFYSYARHRSSENELIMLIIAFTVFSGGIAAYLNLSGLFIAVVTGATLANLLPTSEKIFRLLISREKPILIVFLVLVGASWSPVPESGLETVVVLLAIYLAGRVGGKVVSMAIVRLFFRENLEKGSWCAGLALLGQGGMSVALVANYQLLFGGGLGMVAVSVILVAVMVSEAFAAYAACYALGGKGEQGG